MSQGVRSPYRDHEGVDPVEAGCDVDDGHLGTANILRGKTAGQDYKNYILSLMFYKRLCDQWECEADDAIAEQERQQGRAFSETEKAVFRKRGVSTRRARSATAAVGSCSPAGAGNRYPRRRCPRMLQHHKIPAVPHGFRSSFRDWAAEETDHPREVIEAAYARSDLFERRRRLMDDWATYLAAERGQVILLCRKLGRQATTER